MSMFRIISWPTMKSLPQNLTHIVPEPSATSTKLPAAVMGWLLLGTTWGLIQLPGVEAKDFILESCEVTARDDIALPAQEAGVLLQLPWKEGDVVQQGDLLATINDLQAQAGVELAEIGLAAAQKRTESDIEVIYAQKASEVAKSDWKRDLKVNLRNPRTVSEADLERKKLDYERSSLQIKKATHDQILTKYDVQSKAAELKAAKLALKRRMLLAPYGGQIIELYQHESEWVSPGDPILRLVRFDTLHVEGIVESKDYDPRDIDGKSVTIRVVLAQGREVEANGKIIYVNQLVESGSAYYIRAEVANRQEGKYWLIRPGLLVSMTIHLE